jgi:hypothetical protein
MHIMCLLENFILTAHNESELFKMQQSNEKISATIISQVWIIESLEIF